MPNEKQTGDVSWRTAQQQLAPLYSPGVVSEIIDLVKLAIDRWTSTHADPAAGKILPSEELIKFARSTLSTRPSESGHRDIVARLDWFFAHSRRLHATGYMGHQVPPPLPLAAAFNLASAIANQSSAVFEMSPTGTAVERALIQKVIEPVGWSPKKSDGIMTGGGSLANLTALLTARNVRYPEFWNKGRSAGERKPAIIVSADCHYSIARAAGILGLGTDQVIKSPVDSLRRLCPTRLLATIERARFDGLEPFCVVASAGATPVGSFDDLRAIGRIAHDHGLWFHVDGAHGASVLFSAEHRDLAAGIEMADSIVWDAHKMMFVPALSTFVLYKDRKHSLVTFEQDAPYLLDPEDPDRIWLDGASRTIECTKQVLAMGVWGLWSTYGSDVFGKIIDVTFGLTQQLHDLVCGTPDFTPVQKPQGNIFCFRHTPPNLNLHDEAAVSRHQVAVRKRLLSDGLFYTTSTTIEGCAALRVTVMNPRITERDFRELLQTIRLNHERDANRIT